MTRPRSTWLVSPRYDALFFLGSALLVLPMTGLYHAFEGRVVPLLHSDDVISTYFLFAALFDHPHIFQSFSRTLADPIERERRRGLHTWGLLGFVAAGFAIVLAGLERPFIVFAAYYGSWHIVRQHWGFLRIYKALNADWDALDTALDNVVFYLGMASIWMVGYSDVSTRTVIYAELSAPFPQIPAWLAYGALKLFGVAMAVYVTHQLYRAMRRQPLNTPKLLLLGCALSTHAFVSIVTKLPFLVAEAVQTIYHDVQYQGFVNHYQRRRFGSRVARRFLVASAIYGLLAASVECAALVQRQLKWIAIPFGMIVIYHYYADGRIWRLREAPELAVLLPPKTP